MGALVAGIGTLGLFVAIGAWGLIVQGNSPGIFTVGAVLTVAAVTSGFVAVPYVFGSLVARVARRPWWIVGACAAAALLSLSFRIYLHVTDGGGQAFIGMILLAVPYSVLVLAGWSASLWYSVLQAGGLGKSQSPPATVAIMVTAAVLFGTGGAALGYVLRDSPLWFTIGGATVLVALGLGLWALRRAGNERSQQ